MKPTKKHIAIITGIILFLASLGVYSAFRSDSLEREYVSILTLKNSEALKLISNSITSKNDKKSILESTLKKIKENVPQIALVAAADKDYNIIVAGKNRKHAPGNETLDHILSDFTQKKLEPRSSFPLIIRYYDQSRFYIFVNELDSYYVITAFPYMMTNRQIISFILEAALIAIVFIILTMSVVIIIDRNKQVNTVSVKEEESEIPEEHISLEIMKECSRLVNADTVIIETYNSQNNLFTISLKYSDGRIFTFNHEKNDVKSLHAELVEELGRQSMVLLDKNRTCLVPLVKNGTLMGLVRLIRPLPFKGNDIKQAEDYITANIDELLSISKAG